MLRLKIFTFNALSENTYLLYDETQQCVIIDPGCYDRHEQDALKQFVEEVFTSARMNELFQRNSDLISPYVIGPQATEQSGYSYLNNSSAFTQELSSLKQHVVTRNQAVANYLK